MKVVFGGKFEPSVVRAIDQVLTPHRNVSMHQYYMGLNRKVPKNYADRSGTFIALADEILVPQIDWNYALGKEYRGELQDLDLGIVSTDAGGSEWDSDTRTFVKVLMAKRPFSRQSWVHMSVLDIAHYADEDRRKIDEDRRQISYVVADHYLNRLFLQLRAAREAGALIILSEDDLLVVKEVATCVASSRMPTPFDIPDLTGLVLEPESFCDGLLNFSPPDIQSVATVRSDPAVRGYSSRIQSFLSQPATEHSQRQMFAAMREAYLKIDRVERVKTAFEVGSWSVKPLHYIPVVGEVVGMIEDITDLSLKWADRKMSEQEWCLLGVRMTDIAYRDYLRRKDNMM